MLFGIGIDLLMVPADSRLTVPQSDDDVLDEVDVIADELIAMETLNPDLCDSTVGLDLVESLLEVEMTIRAETPGAALDAAVTLLRTAIHAAGGCTPWDDPPAPMGKIVFASSEALRARPIAPNPDDCDTPRGVPVPA